MAPGGLARRPAPCCPLVLLNPVIIPEWLGWRLCFIFGAVLGIAIVLVRRFIPESPRWLMTHSRIEEAEEIVTHIERQVSRDENLKTLPEARGSITVRTRPHGTTIGTVARELFQSYPRRTVLGLALMITQSFMYNAVSFPFPSSSTKYYDVPTTTSASIFCPSRSAIFSDHSCWDDFSTRSAGNR